MTSKLKCPFCGKELVPTTMGDGDTVLYASVWLPIKNCICNTAASKKIWQALIQAKQDLEQSEKCCSAWETQALDYKAETIALSGKLEIARKALVFVKTLNERQDGCFEEDYETQMRTVYEALEQIEHKEKQNG